MKTSLLLTVVIVMLTGISYCQFSKDEIKAFKKAAKDVGAVGSYDVHGQSFYVTSAPVRLRDSYMFLYFDLTKVNGEIIKSNVRMKIEYNASSWLFMESISIAFGFVQDGDDTLVSTAKMSISSPTRNVNSGGSITEIAVETLNSDMYTLLKYLSLNNRFCSVRLSGSESYASYGVFGGYFTNNLDGLFVAYEDIDFSKIEIVKKK